MNVMRRISRPIAALLVACIWSLCSYIPAAQADLVSTDMLMQADRSDQERERLREILDRNEVRAALTAHGVDAQEVASRIDHLTDAEVHDLASRFEQLPTGAGALELILVVFLVLVITDLLGLTDIFTFIKKPRR